MLSAEQNDRLCRVEGTAEMGTLMRRFWLPVLRSAAVEADGAPQRVTVLGKRHVAFRASDGRVGLLDEACPHRCASLMLARNEANGLRCIYHGWKFGVDGTVLDIPTESDPIRAEALAKRVPVRHYPVHEAGGLVWTYLGEGAAPAFPAFEFTTLSPDHYDLRGATVRANWLQVLESILDSAHLGFLHRSSIAQAAGAASQKNAGAWLTNTAPVLQIEETDYGLREAALRSLPDGSLNARIREVVAPVHVILPGEPGAERQHIITVPVDDVSCMQFFITYNPFRPMSQTEIDTLWFDTDPDANDFARRLPGSDTVWGQDRAAMAAGHFSGLTNRHVFAEDFALLESMGRIVDRTREFLTGTDLTCVRFRQALLRSLDRLADDAAPLWGEARADRDFRRLRTHAAMLQPGTDWRTIPAFAA